VIEGKCSKSEIDVAVEHLTNALNSATFYGVPLKRRTFKSMQNATSTLGLIQKMNKLRTQWQSTHDITLRPLINSLKDQIYSAIKAQISKNWQKTLQGLDTNNMRDTRRITKSLTNTN
jgi:hypothetical protein